MSTVIEHDAGNVYRLEIHGLLRKADLAGCEDTLASEMARVGPVRLLIVLTGFEGWEPHTDWNDLTFYVRHGDAIERIAIVGDERWRNEALMFAAADLRKGPVEFFTPQASAAARAWLSA
jgi:hypothetical protein